MWFLQLVFFKPLWQAPQSQLILPLFFFFLMLEWISWIHLSPLLLVCLNLNIADIYQGGNTNKSLSFQNYFKALFLF